MLCFISRAMPLSKNEKKLKYSEIRRRAVATKELVNSEYNNTPSYSLFGHCPWLLLIVSVKP